MLQHIEEEEYKTYDANYVRPLPIFEALNQNRSKTIF